MPTSRRAVRLIQQNEGLVERCHQRANFFARMGQQTGAKLAISVHQFAHSSMRLGPFERHPSRFLNKGLAGATTAVSRTTHVQ